jgi:hypothetical protein
MGDRTHILRVFSHLLVAAVALTLLSPELSFARPAHRSAKGITIGHSASRLGRTSAPGGPTANAAGAATAQGQSGPANQATGAAAEPSGAHARNGEPKGSLHRGATGAAAAEPAPFQNATGARPTAAPPGRGPQGTGTAPHIDLVTPDEGYGARPRAAADRNIRTSLLPRNAPLGLRRGAVGAHRTGTEHHDATAPWNTPGPARNAIGASVGRAYAPSAAAGHGQAGATTGVAPGASTVSGGAQAAAGPPAAPSSGAGGIGTAGPRIGHAFPAPAGGAAGTPFRPPVTGITGTGVGRPGSGPAAIGGGVKTVAGVSGTGVRPKR